MSFKIRTDASGNGQFTIDSTDVLSINTNTTVSLPTGTANGVAYLNGSKVLTSGSALTFDGTNLRTGGITFADASTQSTGGYTGFRNRIINGAMMIDQRNAGASVTPTVDQTYCVDRWKARLSVASKFSVQQKNGIDSAASNYEAGSTPAGFRNSVKITSLSAYTAGAAEAFGFQQNIEGSNIADMGFGAAGAATFTFSFWVKSSLTGAFSGVLFNNGNTRNYNFTYTINSANTWEQKSITVAGDVGGTWLTNTSNGLQVWWDLGSGSTYTGAAQSWTSSWFARVTGATSVVGTAGATFYITGVQLEKGSVATPFDYRPYGTELALCQRYYQTIHVNGQPVNLYPGISAYTQNSFPVEMRAAPSVVFDNTFPNSALVHWGNVSTAVTYALNVGTTSKSISWQCLRTSGVWASTDWCGHTYVNIKLSAEL